MAGGWGIYKNRVEGFIGKTYCSIMKDTIRNHPKEEK